MGKKINSNICQHVYYTNEYKYIDKIKKKGRRSSQLLYKITSEKRREREKREDMMTVKSSGKITIKLKRRGQIREKLPPRAKKRPRSWFFMLLCVCVFCFFVF